MIFEVGGWRLSFFVCVGQESEESTGCTWFRQRQVSVGSDEERWLNSGAVGAGWKWERERESSEHLNKLLSFDTEEGKQRAERWVPHRKAMEKSQSATKIVCSYLQLGGGKCDASSAGIMEAEEEDHSWYELSGHVWLLPFGLSELCDCADRPGQHRLRRQKEEEETCICMYKSYFCYCIRLYFIYFRALILQLIKFSLSLGFFDFAKWSFFSRILQDFCTKAYCV